MPPPPFFTASPRAGGADAGVIATNDSATESKLRAVQLGYWSDPFITRVSCMPQPPPRSGSPLVNRGYFARVRFVERCVVEFGAAAAAAAEAKGFQVVSLGCGFDSTFFRMRAEGRFADTAAPLKRWVDVDLPSVAEKKRRAVSGDAELAAAAAEGGAVYRVLSADLREAEALSATLLSEGAGLDAALPTLFVSECVLIYLRPAEGDAAIHAVAEAFPASAFVTYEQIRPETAFGKRMLENLACRGCPLLSLQRYPSLAAQEARYASHGGAVTVRAKDMNAVWATLSDEDVRRANRIEMLDEVEEWQLILSHYCFVVAASQAVPPGWVEKVFAKAM